MPSRFRHPGLSVLITLWAAVCSAAPAAGLTIQNVSITATQVGLYEPLEVDFGLSRSYANPYDPDLVDARFQFTGPSGIVREIPAFYQQTSPGWAARIVPLEEGVHNCQIVVSDHLGEQASYPVTFTATSSNARGFVRIDPRDATYMRFDNGEPYLPLGMNLCWGGYNPSLFATWLNEMQNVGANWTRYWMVSYVAQDIEWGAGTDDVLGTYSQSQSQMFDEMLEGARLRDIQVQLCMDSFNGWNTTLYANWNESPYNTANGGPCSRPLDYFILESAKVYARRRMRYIVARWGYNTSVLCWEFFNEIDALNGGGATFWGHEQEVAAWHQEMAQYIRSIDPFSHLRTTSFADDGYFSSYAIFWNLPEMDIVQAHEYSTYHPQAHVNKVRQREIFGKPIIVGEGNYAGSPGDLDSDGRTLHAQVWAGAVVESGIMSWWWDNWIYPNDLYYHYAPVAAFLAGEDWAPLEMVAVTSTRLSGPSVEVFGSAGPLNAFLWVRNLNGATSGLTLRLNQLAPDTYDLEFWNTSTGTIFHTQTANATAGGLDVAFPDFTWDVAVKIKAQAPLLEVSPTALSATGIVGANPPNSSFTITNTGTDILHYAITDDADWLSTSPASGDSNGETDTIQVIYDVTGLALGQYQATITVDDLDSPQSKTVNVELTLNPVPGDFDADGDVDMADFAHLQNCYTTFDQTGITTGCENAEFTGDDFINALDLAVFKGCLSGAGVPADPHCAE